MSGDIELDWHEAWTYNHGDIADFELCLSRIATAFFKETGELDGYRDTPKYIFILDRFKEKFCKNKQLIITKQYRWTTLNGMENMTTLKDTHLHAV